MNESRKQAIENYKIAKEVEAIRLHNEQLNRISKALIKIREFAPRIKELIDTANTCIDNGIHLGKPSTSTLKSPEFCTDGWAHRFGFFIKNPYYIELYKNPSPQIGGHVTGIGSEGGGACGGDFKIDIEGTLVSGVDKKDLLSHLESFPSDFDSFETRFYNYVDSIVNENNS